VEDADMLVDYEQFSKMLLGAALWKTMLVAFSW
jgi:hypothetical protein